MNVEWSQDAEQNRVSVVWYIAQRDLGAALRFDERLDHVAVLLGEQPYMGRAGEISGTRELFPEPTYRLVYEIGSDGIVILSLTHTSQRWPPVD